MKLKSDLKHTVTAQAQAESSEEKARSSLRVAEVELREARDGLQAAQDDLLEARDGLQAAQIELQVVKDELQLSQNEQSCVLLKTSCVIKQRCLMEPVAKRSRLQALLNA